MCSEQSILNLVLSCNIIIREGWRERGGRGRAVRGGAKGRVSIRLVMSDPLCEQPWLSDVRCPRGEGEREGGKEG